MLDHESSQSSELVPTEATRLRQGYRTEPELGGPARQFDVDVRSLGTIGAVEEESGSLDPPDRRHASRTGSVLGQLRSIRDEFSRPLVPVHPQDEHR